MEIWDTRNCTCAAIKCMQAPLSPLARILHFSWMSGTICHSFNNLFPSLHCVIISFIQNYQAVLSFTFSFLKKWENKFFIQKRLSVLL